ncbi:MAG: pilus assembly protein PilM [Dehalococcoidales bacterium]|nr:pilus assembly protein PilM [Dehalococcoidales bacterium]
MAKQVTTLFIEDNALKLLVGRGRQVEKWASLPLEPGLVKHGLIQDSVQIADKIKELLRLTKVSAKKVAIGLSEPGSLYRIVTLPKLPDAILPEAIKREAERVIPLSLDEVYLIHQVISAKDQETTLFLAAVSRTAVDNAVKAMQLAGLKPYLMDLVPLALCRIIEQPSVIVVSLRSSNFEIAVMSDRVPQVIRSLSLPGEAESLVDKLPTISEELDRTITFYNSSHADKQLDSNTPIFVDGDLVQVPESWPLLVGTLGSQVSPIPAVMQPVADFDASQFTVNIGLVFKENGSDVAGSVINLNALPKALQPEKPKASRVIWPVVAFLAVLLLAFVWMLGNNTAKETKDINSQITAKNNDITQIKNDTKAIKDEVAQLQNQVQPLEDQIMATDAAATSYTNLINSMADNRDIKDNNTRQIWSLVPSGISITSVDVRDSAFIQGVAQNESQIFSYARSLKDSGIYPLVLIQSISLDEEDVEGIIVRTYQFAIIAQ